MKAVLLVTSKGVHMFQKGEEGRGTRRQDKRVRMTDARLCDIRNAENPANADHAACNDPHLCKYPPPCKQQAKQDAQGSRHDHDNERLPDRGIVRTES